MIKLQHILESLLSEVGENTAAPYKITRREQDGISASHVDVRYYWTTEEEVDYVFTISKYYRKSLATQERRVEYNVSFGIIQDKGGSGADYKATSKTTQTGNLRRVMATVIGCLKEEIGIDSKEVTVDAIYMEPTKNYGVDQRRMNLYLNYIKKNMPPGSTVVYDKNLIKINLPSKSGKDAPLNEAFDKPYPTETVTSSKSKESRSFTTSEGHEYAIEFNVEESTGEEETWSSEFYLKNSPSTRQYAISGTGDQMRVFATVLATMKDFLDRRRPRVLEFLANKKSGTSRDRLYSTLVNRYTPTGYRVETQEFKSFNVYRIVRT